MNDPWPHLSHLEVQVDIGIAIWSLKLLHAEVLGGAFGLSAGVGFEVFHARSEMKADRWYYGAKSACISVSETSAVIRTVIRLWTACS